MYIYTISLYLQHPSCSVRNIIGANSAVRIVFLCGVEITYFV